jgi:hypothetical protein
VQLFGMRKSCKQYHNMKLVELGSILKTLLDCLYLYREVLTCFMRGFVSAFPYYVCNILESINFISVVGV